MTNAVSIHLHGYLGDTYGRDPIELYATSMRDVVRGLGCRFGTSFTIAIRANDWHFTKGSKDLSKDIPVKGVSSLTTEEVDFPIHYEELHIYPKLSGAIWIGIVIGSIVSTVASGVSLVSFGLISGTLATKVAIGLIAMAASAAINAIVAAVNSPSIDYEKAEVDRNVSFLYNGVVNVIEQGGPVPLVYGQHLVGSTVISAAIVSEQLGIPDNYLSEGVQNFWNPVLDDWANVGATASKVDGQLLVTKTVAADSYGAIETPLTLISDTYFYITVVYLAPYSHVVGDESSSAVFRYYQGIEVSIADGTSFINGEVITDPSLILLFYTPFSEPVRFTARFRFKTRDIQESTRLRIAPLTTAPIGTVATILSVKVSDGDDIIIGLFQ